MYAIDENWTKHVQFNVFCICCIYFTSIIDDINLCVRRQDRFYFVIIVHLCVYVCLCVQCADLELVFIYTYVCAVHIEDGTGTREHGDCEGYMTPLSLI